jgi:hypothetical protein
MTEIVKRPSVSLSPGRGLLRNDHFQIAYATNDLERARNLLADRYGIRKYQTAEGTLNEGGYIRAELAWVGGMMYELIQAHGPGSEFINRILNPREFSIRHHHSGFFVYEESAWQTLEREVDQGGWSVLQRRTIDGFLRVFYVEAAELGHYLEYIFPTPDGISFFENVPRS